jgi:hypothetical protein
MGPESVLIDWVMDTKRCSSYQILNLPNTTPMIQSVGSPPARLDGAASGIQPEKGYNFAVSCLQNSVQIGLDTSISITTWSRFDGALDPIEVQSDGTFRISWKYLKDPLLQFRVYAKDLSSNSTSFGTLLNGCTVASGKNEVIVGSTECPIAGSGLNPGKIYQFRVVAVYPDGTDSMLTQNPDNTVIQTINPNFQTPNCTLSRLGLGADENYSFLYLRCRAPLAPARGTPSRTSGGRARTRRAPSRRGT